MEDYVRELKSRFHSEVDAVIYADDLGLIVNSLEPIFRMKVNK